MGIVYRAQDTFIGRPVAVKLVRLSEGDVSERVKRRMHREVMITGRLIHPNIATLFDAGIEDGAAYLVMELVDGETLKERMRRGPLPRKEAVGIALQALDAVAYAHRQGVVHLDLKPENLLLSREGKIKVVDFSIAKVAEFASIDLSLSSGAMGTLAYMAPEQLLSESVDPRSDVYALGVVLFEMVLGRSLAGIMSPVARAKAMGSPRQDPELPVVPGQPKLTRAIFKALATVPDDRFPDAESFAAALTDLDSGWRRFLHWRRGG